MTGSALWFYLSLMYFPYASNEFIEKCNAIPETIQKILEKNNLFSYKYYEKKKKNKAKAKAQKFLMDIVSQISPESIYQVADAEAEVEAVLYDKNFQNKKMSTDFIISKLEENLKQLNNINQENLQKCLVSKMQEYNTYLALSNANRPDHMTVYAAPCSGTKINSPLKSYFSPIKHTHKDKNNDEDRHMFDQGLIEPYSSSSCNEDKCRIGNNSDFVNAHSIINEFSGINELKILTDNKSGCFNYKEIDSDDILINMRYKSKYKRLFQDYLIRKHEELSEKNKEVILSRSAEEKNHNPDDIVCLVCNDGDYEDNNLIVYCSNCQMTVHQNCYGIVNIPEEDWLCYPCQFYNDERAKDIECILCPIKGGAMKPSNLKLKTAFCTQIINLRRNNYNNINMSMCLNNADFSNKYLLPASSNLNNYSNNYIYNHNNLKENENENKNFLNSFKTEEIQLLSEDKICLRNNGIIGYEDKQDKSQNQADSIANLLANENNKEFPLEIVKPESEFAIYRSHAVNHIPRACNEVMLNNNGNSCNIADQLKEAKISNLDIESNKQFFLFNSRIFIFIGLLVLFIYFVIQ